MGIEGPKIGFEKIKTEPTDGTLETRADRLKGAEKRVAQAIKKGFESVTAKKIIAGGVEFGRV